MYSFKKNENIYLGIFYDFQSSMGLKRSKCDALNGTTQGWVCFLFLVILLEHYFLRLIILCMRKFRTLKKKIIEIQGYKRL
jgi:hypothetical protein